MNKKNIDLKKIKKGIKYKAWNSASDNLTADKLLDKLVEDMYTAGIEITYNFLLEGKMQPEDVSSEENQKLIRSEIKKKLYSHYTIISDYREGLYKKAIDFYVKGDYNISIVLFATIFEHSINLLIKKALIKKGLSIKIQKQIIRSVNFQGKYTWLSMLLELPKFNPTYLDNVQQIAEQRNAFLHYKWNSNVFNSDENPKIFTLESLKKTIIYLKKYDARATKIINNQ